jgi:creatinine amidohydrolase/Fe(II)-dependent formamide hydrolase-like protein
VTKEGIWGAPEQANSEKGKALIEVLVHDIRQQVKALFDLVNTHISEKRG